MRPARSSWKKPSKKCRTSRKSRPSRKNDASRSDMKERSRTRTRSNRSFRKTATASERRKNCRGSAPTLKTTRTCWSRGSSSPFSTSRRVPADGLSERSEAYHPRPSASPFLWGLPPGFQAVWRSSGDSYSESARNGTKNMRTVRLSRASPRTSISISGEFSDSDFSEESSDFSDRSSIFRVSS